MQRRLLHALPLLRDVRIRFLPGSAYECTVTEFRWGVYRVAFDVCAPGNHKFRDACDVADDERGRNLLVEEERGRIVHRGRCPARDRASPFYNMNGALTLHDIHFALGNG